VKDVDAIIGKTAVAAGSAGLGLQVVIESLQVAVLIANLVLAVGGICLLYARYRRMKKADPPDTPDA